MKRALACALLACLSLGTDVAYATPIQASTFVPINAEAQAALAQGDRAVQLARAQNADRHWADALDSWRSALELSTAGDLVPLLVQAEGDELWRDPDGSFAARREGVTVAVLRRLSELEERARWTARFSELAGKKLREARTVPALLARVERNFPATRAAALASLRLADYDLETGAIQAARTWLERGRVHVQLASELDDLLSSYERREEFASALKPPPREETWREATSLRLEREVDLHTRSSGISPQGEGFDRGLIQGGVFLDDGRVVVHHPAAVFVIDDSGAGPIFEPRKLLEQFRRRSGSTFAPSGQAWPLELATDGEDLFFVLGRAIVAGNTSAVCRLSPPAETGEATQLRWALTTQGHLNSDGVITPLEEHLEPGTWEFQPGPAVFGSLLIVQARQWLPNESGSQTAVDASRPRCFALALDIETGIPVWTRFLGKGSDVQRDFGARFVGGSRPAAPAQPVASSRGHVFCATGVGLGVLLDSADGRVLWTFSPERREPDELGWIRPQRPSFVTAGGEESVLWGPPDSNRLYWLRAHADLQNRGLQTYLPAAIGSARAALGAGPPEAILLGFAGAARSLSSLNPVDGEITQGLRLRRTEEFRGASLTSESRVFLCSDRTLYLFDRERELLLLASYGLQTSDSKGGGNVIASGNRIVVLGPNRVFVFEAESGTK